MNMPLSPAKKPWRARLQAQARRIDAMSLRERVFLFLSAAALLAALLDGLLISPLNLERQAQAAAQQKQAAELKNLREQFVQSTQAGLGAGGQPQQRLAAALARQRQLREEMTHSSGGGYSTAGKGGQAQLPALLATVLAQHQGLSLLRLNLLSEPPPHAAGIVLDGLQWQGVELQLAGNYKDQMKYLSDLERGLPGLQWGELRLSAPTPEQPLLMQVQLFLLRAQP